MLARYFIAFGIAIGTLTSARGQPVASIPDVPDFPLANSIIPGDPTGTPADRIAAAQRVIGAYLLWQKLPTTGKPPAFRDWFNPRSDLTSIKSTDAEFAAAMEAAAKLDSFGRDLAKAEIRWSDKTIDDDVTGRKAFAASYEKEMLRKWLNVTVTTEGPKASTLKIKYVLASKAMAFNMSEDYDLMEKYRSKGFQKMVLWDGYNHTWTLDLRTKR